MSARNLTSVSVGMAIIVVLCVLAAVYLPLPAHAQHPAGHSGSAMTAPEVTPPSVPQEKEIVQETPQIEISPDQQQLIGVKTVTVTRQPMSKLIRTVGRMEVDETKLATINTKIEGWIEKLYVDYTGKFVRRGEPLVEIYSPELLAAQREFLNLLQWSKQPTDLKQDDSLGQMFARDKNSLLAAAKERLALWDITQDQIREIERGGEPRRTLTLFSPLSGYIVQKMALQGMRVMAGEKLFDIADLSSLWVISDIYEYELPLIKIGQTAKITLSYLPGREFNSRVDYIYPSVTTETRTVKVRFTVSNSDGQLKPQMYTNIDIKIHLGDRLAVPESALLDTGKGQVVYVDLGEGIFEPREVTPGIRADGKVEVLKGLKPEEKVAAAANFLLDSEAQLKGVTPLQAQ